MQYPISKYQTQPIPQAQIQTQQAPPAQWNPILYPQQYQMSPQTHSASCNCSKDMENIKFWILLLLLVFLVIKK